MKLIKNGEVSEYQGTRTKESLMAFAIGTGGEPDFGGEL